MENKIETNWFWEITPVYKKAIATFLLTFLAISSIDFFFIQGSFWSVFSISEGFLVKGIIFLSYLIFISYFVIIYKLLENNIKNNGGALIKIIYLIILPLISFIPISLWSIDAGFRGTFPGGFIAIGFIYSWIAGIIGGIYLIKKIKDKF